MDLVSLSNIKVLKTISGEKLENFIESNEFDDAIINCFEYKDEFDKVINFQTTICELRDNVLIDNLKETYNKINKSISTKLLKKYKTLNEEEKEIVKGFYYFGTLQDVMSDIISEKLKYERLQDLKNNIDKDDKIKYSISIQNRLKNKLEVIGVYVDFVSPSKCNNKKGEYNLPVEGTKDKELYNESIISDENEYVR